MSKFRTIMLGLFVILIFSMVSSVIESFFLLPNFNEAANQKRLERHFLWYLIPLLVAPIIEEIIFRGVLLSSLTKKIPFKYSNLICAFIFSLLHLELYFLPYFLNGLVYGWVKTKNKSLCSAIILHFLYNLMALVI